jgi:hypothetical protein
MLPGNPRRAGKRCAWSRPDSTRGLGRASLVKLPNLNTNRILRERGTHRDLRYDHTQSRAGGIELGRDLRGIRRGVRAVLRANGWGGWTAVFLASTVATSATGFLFLPSVFAMACDWNTLANRAGGGDRCALRPSTRVPGAGSR